MTKNRSEAQAAEGDRGGEGSVDQMYDRRNTNRQRGRVWAISMLGNAKSNTSSKDPRGRVGRHGQKVIAPYPGNGSVADIDDQRVARRVSEANQILPVRMDKKSADAVVAKKPVKADGAKGRRTNETDEQTNLDERPE
jgi:hypothetical protein